MGFFGILIILIIGACIWQWLKEQFSGGSSYSPNQYHHNHLTVDCPYCHETLFIDGPGNWNCENCKNTFHYDQGGHTIKMEDFLSPPIEAIVRLFAKMAKADGVVTQEELQKVDAIIKEEFSPSADVLTRIRRIFNEAKDYPDTYQNDIYELYQYFSNDSVVLTGIIEYLHDIAMIDNGVHPRQEVILDYAMSQFRLNFEGSNQYQNTNKQYTGPSLDEYYKTLGCSPTDSIETIKKNYRNLIKEYHPDKYMNQNLPKDFIELANRRVQEIQEAYEAIMKQKAS